MYKTMKRGLTAFSITRGLKQGLTAFAILTAGAGGAFAQTTTPTAPALPTVVVHDIVDTCSDGLFFRNPGLCTPRIVRCINDPFDQVNAYIHGTGRCNETLGTIAHNVAKVRYCGKAGNRIKPVCTEVQAGETKSILDRPNAANWAKQNPNAPTTLDTSRRRHQFLKGTASGLDNTGAVSITSYAIYKALYFDTAEFNNIPLGGDATDGVAFFRDYTGPSYYYAGILSGTDLGAPLDEPTGTTAIWVGSINDAKYTDSNKDFVLEVTFGSDIEGKDGSIKAFARGVSWWHKFYYINGTFDDSGLIEGTVSVSKREDNTGKYIADHRGSVTSDEDEGILTGLIGQDGAVGVFHSNTRYASYRYSYSGGFVARPVNLVPGLSPTFIADTCTGLNGDPFHEFCHIGVLGEVAMDEERSLRVVECIHGGNASDDALCENAIDRNPCILNPFDIACVTNDKFATHHVVARANRIAFCNDANNAQNVLCTGDNLVNVCGYDPFTSACFGNDAASVTGLLEKRMAKNKECGAHSSANNPTCASVLERASSASFLHSFATELNTVAARVNLRNEFLKNLDTAEDAVRTFGTRPDRPFVSIALASVREDGLALGGEATDGVASFGSTYNDIYGYHAGILSSTDLGKPLTAESAPTGEWKGIFETTGPSRFQTKEDFTLTVTFTGGEDHVGKVDAFVTSNYRQEYYHLTGNFDDNGIIKGDVDYGSFRSDESGNADSGKKGTGRRYPGRLQGLIGEQGAVGAFISGTTNSDSGNYAGGFVASPFAAPVTVKFSDWVNSFDDDLLTSPTTGYSPKNQFLKGGATELINITELSNIGVTDVIPGSLNLADATFGGNRLNRDATDGVAFFRGTHSAIASKQYYAGILSGTDLGGLVTETTGSANWKGSLQIVRELTADAQPSAVDFTLTVNFGGTRSISSIFRPYPDGNNWTLSGNFDTNGIITGNIAESSSSIAKVTGLIGQQGAVGVFHGITNSNTFSGGFVACPYDDEDNRCQ